MLGGRSFCMEENKSMMTVIMQDQVDCLARIVYGLSAKPMDLSLVQSNFVTTKESAETLGIAFVTRCSHSGGPTHKHAKECFPRITTVCGGRPDEFEQSKADHKAIADMMFAYLGRQWPYVQRLVR